MAVAEVAEVVEEIDERPPIDLHVTACAVEFTTHLKQLGIFFQQAVPVKVENQAATGEPPAGASKEANNNAAANNPVFIAKGGWPRGCACPAYSAGGHKYFVKLSPGGSMETSLLLQAKALKEKNSEDVCLPILVNHFHHHMSSTSLLLLDACEYGSLVRVIKASDPVPMHRQYVARIIRGVACALHFLHTQEIAHGAVRASNIFVDSEMVGRLGGLSRAKMVFKGHRYKSTQVAVYKAPEADQPGALAFPQDMFALGVALYRTIVGSLPKRTEKGGVDYKSVESSKRVPLNPDLWRTTQLLLSENLDLRPSAGQLLHTDWVERAKTEDIKQLLHWRKFN